MKLAKLFSVFFLALHSVYVLAIDTNTIAGTVRDAAGQPVGGITVVLASIQDAGVTRQAATNEAGQYSFTALPAGRYTVSAKKSENATASSLSIVIPLEKTTSVDLVLSISAPSPQAPLQFEAAGIRGLIDPGGYSASADSAAATGLMRGIADLRRTDSSAAQNGLPCSQEPELRRAAEHQPALPGAGRHLAEFYLAHREPAKAIPLLKHNLKLDSTDMRSSQDLAQALLLIGQFQEAQALLATLIADRGRAKSPAEAHQLLAGAYEGTGLFKQAADQYRIANEEEPTEESVFGEGYELILTGSPSSALDVFNTGASSYPHSVALHIGMGASQFLLGHADSSVRTLLAAIDLDPADPRPYSFLAAASSVSSVDAERVSSAFQHFLAQHPESGSAYYFSALSLSRRNPPATSSEVESLLRRAIQLDPSQAKAHLQLADLLEQRQSHDSAIAEYETTLHLAPELSEARYRLALAYRRAGHPEQSTREMQTFQQTKSKAGGDAINIAQFISVMDIHDPSHLVESQCAVSP